MFNTTADAVEHQNEHATLEETQEAVTEANAAAEAAEQRRRGWSLTRSRSGRTRLARSRPAMRKSPSTSASPDGQSV